MAEVGLIGTIVGIAGAGIKLSITLYTFSETVATGPSEIKNIARDVSLTSSVLEELGANLKQDDQARLYSGSAVKTAKDVVVECEGVFKEIDAVVARAMESASKKGLKKGGKLALSALDRLKWPFLQPKMEVLRGNLERLKSTLVLMLNVLTYARDLRAEKKTSSKDDDGYQRTLLENLLRANEDATRNYQHLLKTIGPRDETVVLEQPGPTSSGGMHLSSVPEAPSAGNPFIAMSRGIDSVQDVAISSPKDNMSPPQPELESTIRACVRRIERALLQFEQSSSVASHSPRVGVHIELEKDFGDSRYAPGRPNPWVVLSIIRRERGWPQQQDNTPSHPESNVGDDLDMYASVAAGALESISIGDEPLTVVQGAQYRDRTQAQINDAVAVMRENINRVSQRAERLDNLESKTEPLASSAAGFRRKPSRKPWYSSVWESLPSPTAAMGTIQETVKNSGLFFGVEEESENPDTVLQYNQPGAGGGGGAGSGGSGASQRPDSAGPRIVRSPTFDDILQAPTLRDRHTPSLPTTTSTAEGANPNSEDANNPEGTRAPSVPTAGAGEESTHQEATNPPSPADADKDTPVLAIMEAGSAAVPISTGRTENPPTEARSDELSGAEEAAESPVKDTLGKEELAAEREGEPDAIDQLLKEWTTLYNDQ